MAKGKDGAELLGDYLRTHALTREQFAEKVGSTGAAVSRWVTRDRVPSIAWAMKIERVTGIPLEAWAKVERKRAA